MAISQLRMIPRPGKYVSTMNDATIWEPATPERQKARMADSDAFATPRGGVGVTVHRLPLGYALKTTNRSFNYAHEDQ